MHGLALRQKSLCLFWGPSAAISGNLAFEESGLETAQTGGFARTEYIWNRRLLDFVYDDPALRNEAAQQFGKLRIRYEVKAASEVVAVYRPLAVRVSEHNRFHAV